MPGRKPSESFNLPEGFLYGPEFLTEEQEETLLELFRQFDFRAFNFHGYIAKRRIIDYGLEYDFSSRRTSPAEAIPDFLKPFRHRAAQWAAIGEEEICEALLTEYTPGTPIGWHRDVPQFEIIIGISLAGTCRMRFKPYKSELSAPKKLTWLTLEPRSIYMMRGPARWHYLHSIPAVESLRYSITFRTLRKKREK